MGFSVVDFFVRECRAVVEGDMIIVRVGSCGSVKEDLTVGTIAVPEAAVAITRIYDHFHPSTFAEQDAPDALQGYSVTKPLPAGTRVHQALMDALRATCPQASKGLFQGQRPKMCGEGLNASADSFYSSQGRKSESLIDDNEGLIAAIQKSHPKLSTLEMETFVLFHLALCAGYAAERKERDLGSKTGSLPRIESAAMQMMYEANTRILLCCQVQMLTFSCRLPSSLTHRFVDRNSQGIITPSEVKLMEEWGGKAVCEALASISISADKTHPAENSVWAL